MDTTEIEALVALMRRHGIAELEHEAGGQRLRLRLDDVAPVAATSAPVAEAAPAPAPGEIEVRAAMAGCFYRAPDPSASPFVDPGDRVAAGQTLALLEAMKMMTPVEADSPGIVSEIHAQNGAMVARGELLFTLAPVAEG